MGHEMATPAPTTPVSGLQPVDKFRRSDERKTQCITKRYVQGVECCCREHQATPSRRRPTKQQRRQSCSKFFYWIKAARSRGPRPLAAGAPRSMPPSPLRRPPPLSAQPRPANRQGPRKQPDRAQRHTDTRRHRTGPAEPLPSTTTPSRSAQRHRRDLRRTCEKPRTLQAPTGEELGARGHRATAETGRHLWLGWPTSRALPTCSGRGPRRARPGGHSIKFRAGVQPARVAGPAYGPPDHARPQPEQGTGQSPSSRPRRCSDAPIPDRAQDLTAVHRQPRR